MINIYLDTETTGLTKDNGVWQVAGLIYDNDVWLESFNLEFAPLPNEKINKVALKMSGMTEKELRGLQPSEKALAEFQKLLKRYINPFNKKDKAYMYGYNVRFDSDFLRRWFKKNNDPYFGAWFWFPPVDVMNSAAVFLKDRRHTMKNFKLKTVAIEIGVNIDDIDFHDAVSDALVTKKINDLLSGEV